MGNVIIISYKGATAIGKYEKSICSGSENSI